MTIRAFWKATKVESAQEPYDTIHLKVMYPAQISANQHPFASDTVDRTKAPFPIVIFFSGANCDSLMYQWLAVKLVESGSIVILFNWLAENIPGIISLTPGVNLAAWSRDGYGTVPSALILPLLLAELEHLQSDSILAGMLDLEKIILGGHSAGGRIALENAEPKFFSQVRAAFSYGAHSAAPFQLGYKSGTVLSLPSSVPMLIMGGTRDGVIAENSNIYGVSKWETAETPIVKTFREAIAGGRNDSYLVILEGANHFSIADRLDSTIEVTALDFPPTQSEAQIRWLMSSAISLFIDAHVRQQEEASEQLRKLLESDNPLVASFECK